MSNSSPGYRGRLAAAAVAGLLILFAPLTACGVQAEGPLPSGPPPASSAATPGPSTPAPVAPPIPPSQTPSAAASQVLPASQPLTLEIPSIGVTTDLLSLGLRSNGSLEVPEDTGNGAPAGWYNGSPTPGERGPAVVLGHVNALGGNQGVFAQLRSLSQGSDILVRRADGTTAAFSMTKGATYSKGDFPTLEVYGNTEDAELRLITCDGYNAATGLFDDNYVVYAKLKT